MWKSKGLYGVAMAAGFVVMFSIPLLTPVEWQPLLCGVAIGAVQIGGLVLAWWLWKSHRR